VFPSAQSDNPVCGTSEIADVNKDLGLKQNITATQMRHYIASEVSEGDVLSNKRKRHLL